MCRRVNTRYDRSGKSFVNSVFMGAIDVIHLGAIKMGHFEAIYLFLNLSFILMIFNMFTFIAIIIYKR